MSPRWLLITLLVVDCYKFGKAQKIIGAICDDGDFLLEAAFRAALEAVSSEEDPYEAYVKRTTPGDVVEVHTAMCSVLEANVFGVLGPTSINALKHVQSIADYVELPQILIDTVVTQSRNWSAINLYPNHVAFSQVFADIIEVKGWEEFTLIYEGAELLPFFDSILTLQDLETDKDVLKTIVQLPDDGDYRSHLQTVKRSGSVNYLINCRRETLPELLLQAQQVGIMSDEHSYIIMNPDFQTIDIDPFKHGGANITGVRLFDPSLELIQTYIKSINEKVAELTKEQIEDAIAGNGLTLNLALVYDAVTVYVAGIKATSLEVGSNVTCDDDQSWNYGSSLLNTIKTIEEEGLTGLIKFDDDGFRSDFEVEVLEVMPHGFERVGSWNIEDGYVETRTIIPPAEAEGTDSMKGKHFIILTALSAPYGMLKESSEKLEGNDRYEGFGIELIEELAIMNEFNYTFDIQADGVYGSLDKTTGKWSGMMEKVMDGRADFAITDLTITSARQKAVDFTSPFMNLGITILYKKPTKQPPDLFSFISPFSLEVWGWIAGAYVGVSLLLFFLGRIAPEEWQNPYPCIEEPETLDNQFTMANSFWFTLGSVLTQGSEIAPIAVSTRMAGSMWWFFTLIMVSSYTANLAAFLTVESKFYAIKTVQDLASNPYGITYGSKRKGATFGFFKESDNLLYQKMYQYMEDHPELQTSSNDEGLERVKSEDENYAFLMESTSIEYMVERNCDVAQVGGLLDSKGYGIAMKKNSPYRQPMSESILQLQEEGKLTRIKDKWWKEKRGGGACADEEIRNCTACFEGKQSAKPFAKGEATCAKQKLEIVHSDMCGPMTVCSWSGARYLLTFTDDFTRKSFAYLLKHKSQDDDDSSGEAQPLVLANVGGVFIVLAAGSGLAVFCAFLEMIVDVWVVSHQEKVSFLEELKAELKFIVTGDAETKPVRHREPSGSGSGGSKKSKADDEESQKNDDDEKIDDDRLNPVPTPRSERSAQSHHSRHTLHSRRQSNAVQMARMRKFSKATY